MSADDLYQYMGGYIKDESNIFPFTSSGSNKYHAIYAKLNLASNQFVWFKTITESPIITALALKHDGTTLVLAGTGL